ncbi:MAG TPA: homoserine dehydrogenase [Leptospiraceae bacterium]|nr:homoserine dehydrogenase [Leptospiraceae bacterium]HMW04724.1 homoserine dehydrogenase [Leptospiraceae bacterium]HMX31755.1 homoserine dehydrogenase [Leptospiraceae bacterium]HMY30561.1 homoserine dehydrogenase [Leptospiraceae bacterium]HMZ64138.1 homoserine dehydrogenase [Leptospiraceae bacterium]
MKQINIGLIGAGTVGSGLIEILHSHRKQILDRTGIDLNLVKICDTDTSRIPSYFKGEAVTDFKKITEDPKIQVVVELVGGTGIAYEIVKSALSNGKAVVTANKALLSEKGPELFQLAEEKKVEIGYEASVGGAIPVIRSIKTGLVANDFQSIFGILNGTTNYILTKMEEDNIGYADALKQAQDLGFAEKDPTFDVEGIDAAHKLSILIGIAFNKKIKISDIHIEGISKLSEAEIHAAKLLGLRIKLLAVCKQVGDHLEARVEPTMIPLTHPIASVRNEMNAIFFETSFSGPSMLLGKGAGSLPTASAIISDLVFYGSRLNELGEIKEKNLFEEGKLTPPGEIKARYYLRFKTVDRPGVLGELTSIIGRNLVSISSMRQNESNSEPVELIIITHEALEKDVRNSLMEIDKRSDIIKGKSIMIRLEDLI